MDEVLVVVVVAVAEEEVVDHDIVVYVLAASAADYYYDIAVPLACDDCYSSFDYDDIHSIDFDFASGYY